MKKGKKSEKSEIKIVKNKKVKTKEIKENKMSLVKKDNKFYLDYIQRTILFGILFIITIFSSLLLFYKSLNFQEMQTIRYSENGNIDYKVYLKENDFYEVPYLQNSPVYITNLIKNIETKFNYQFLIEEPSDFNFSYSIIAKLSIYDSSRNVLYEKDYPLMSTKTKADSNKSLQNISETISINYDYYNSLANSFKSTYGLDTTSQLAVYLKINRRISSPGKKIDLTDNNNMIITIPLNQRTISIKTDSSSVNENNSIVKESNVSISNILFVVLSGIVFVASVAALLKFLELAVKLVPKKSKYDKLLKKILTEYDRLIVETSTTPKFDGKNIIKINKIEELLDARDNFKRPIMYHNLINHQKCYFYIENGDTYYLFVLKAVDLESQNEKKTTKSKK